MGCRNAEASKSGQRTLAESALGKLEPTGSVVYFGRGFGGARDSAASPAARSPPIRPLALALRPLQAPCEMTDPRALGHGPGRGARPVKAKHHAACGSSASSAAVLLPMTPRPWVLGRSAFGSWRLPVSALGQLQKRVKVEKFRGVPQKQFGNVEIAWKRQTHTVVQVARTHPAGAVGDRTGAEPRFEELSSAYGR